MPLRSVEAASRDDAIAAAREQFGPQARVVGVRRVRSGGVLGFFATERYVAEVAELAPETAVRPTGPSGFGDDEPPADFSSPLASAAPARARATAPPRNGAAAWAAAAAPRSSDDIPDEVRAAAAAARAARSAGRAAEPAPARSAARTSPRPADDERVSELVGLLTAHPAEPAASGYSRTSPPRAAFPRAGATSRSGEPLVDDDETETPVRGGGQRVLPAAAPTAPSPFTAALARMVAGDQEVRQAVHEALATPASETAAQPAETRDAEAWPPRSEPTRSAETPVPPSPAHQEEETVGDLVEAPPSPTDLAVEVPTWAAEPEAPTSSTSQREEAIADLLRGALAQGHSDEALAGILRKVLAGASPQSALAEPVGAPAEPVLAVPTLPVPPLDLTPVPEIGDDVPAVVVPVVDRPFADELSTRVVVPRTVAPAPVAEAVEEAAPVAAETSFAPAEVSLAPAPVVLSTSPTSMWGVPASSSLWGEAAAVPSARTDDASVPAAVTQEPVEAPLFPASIAVEPVVDAVVETPVVESPVAEAVIEEAVIEEALAEDEVVEEAEVAEVAELAPVLARTASDPAPMMTLDATTVMPPLSLLPPLPSSRGRGRPPVPPAAPRAAAPRPPAASTQSAGTEPAAAAEVEAPEVDRTLATVTRLPVAPLMAGPDVPELPEDFDQLCAEELLAAPEPTPMFAAAAAAAAAPEAVASGDVVDRLVQLGLPAELLGSTFRADVAQLGTYAALTRSLALQLPKAPELPRGAGEAVFVVGPGADALRAARSLAAALHLDPDCVQWATRGDLAGLAPRSSRITSVDVAVDRRQESIADGTVTIVAVDAPLRADAYWMAQLVGVWAPVAVWAVVEATRKPEDLEAWLDGLPRVDALVVQDADLSADPAAVLRRVDAPVAVVDGARATPHRWASLLCERLESTTT